MSLAATVALNNPEYGAQGERFQADYGRRYSTGRGTPALNPSSNTPPEREVVRAGNRLPNDGPKRRSWTGRLWCGAASMGIPGHGRSWWWRSNAGYTASATAFTASSHDAEDLTQDVFIKLYANLRSFDPAKGSFHTWITTLTRNLLVDHFRRSRQQRATDSIDAGWDQGNDAPRAEPLVDQRTTPLQHAVQNQLQHMVQSALAKVSPELREAVILRDLQDMDYKEIAEVLAIPQGTVKSRISRGRAELARLLERTKGQVM